MTVKDIYDLVVVGASPEGIQMVQEVSSFFITRKIALVDDDFGDKLNSCFDADHIELLQKHMKYLSYLNGLLLLEFSDGSRLVTANLIIATGKQFLHNGLRPGEYTDSEFKLKNEAKSTVAVVGDNIFTIDVVNKLAKRFNKVVIIADTDDWQFNPRLADNVLTITNAKITGRNYKKTQSGVEQLAGVTLNTGRSVECKAVVYADNVHFNVPDAAASMLTLNPRGEIKTKENNAVMNVPNLYAIGEVSDRYFDNTAVMRLLVDLEERNKWQER